MDLEAELQRVDRAKRHLAMSGAAYPAAQLVQFTVRLFEAFDLTRGTATDEQLVSRAALDLPGGPLGLLTAAPVIADLSLSSAPTTAREAAAAAVQHYGSTLLRSLRTSTGLTTPPPRTELERDRWRTGITSSGTIPYDYRAVRDVVLAHLPELEPLLDDGDPIHGSDGSIYSILGGPAWNDFAKAVKNNDHDRVLRHAVMLQELLHHGDIDVENAAEIEYVMQINNDAKAQDALVDAGYGDLVATLPQRVQMIEHRKKRAWWRP